MDKDRKMTLGKIFSHLRSYMQLSAIDWKHNISQLWDTKVNSGIKEISNREKDDVKNLINSIYADNLLNLNQETDYKIMREADSARFTGINDLFLLGMLFEFIETRPALPVEPFTRVMTHLVFHYVTNDEMTLDGARNRIQILQHLYNSADSFLDDVIDLGRHAYRTHQTDVLSKCHKDVRNLSHVLPRLL